MMAQSPEEVPLPLPAPLKLLLEDDCFWILRRAKLVHLPAELTVESLLRDFYFTCLDGSTEDTNLHLLSEVLDGVKTYFDFTLLDHLLYGPEKEQHKTLGILNPVYSKKSSGLPVHVCEGVANGSGSACQRTCGQLPSQVYGPIHLLRLFVKLPHFLFCAQIHANHVQLLQVYFRDLLGYMCSRREELFLQGNYYETNSCLSVTSGSNSDDPTSEPTPTE